MTKSIPIAPVHDFHEKAEATDSGNFSGMAKNLKCLIVALPLGFQLKFDSFT